MGNVSSKPSSGPVFSASTPSSPTPYSIHNSLTSAAKEQPTRASFSVESSSAKERRLLQHQRSYSYSARPFTQRSQHSDSGNSTGHSTDKTDYTSISTDTNLHTSSSVNNTDNDIDTIIHDHTPIASTESTGKGATEAVHDLNTARAEQAHAALLASSSTATAIVDPRQSFDKPLPASPHTLLPPVLSDKESQASRKEGADQVRSLTSISHHSATENILPKNVVSDSLTRQLSLSRQSIHSQSSLSDKSIISSSSSGRGSGNSSGNSRNDNTPVTSVASGTTESLGQLSLQRFPTGESEYKTKPLSQKSRTSGHLSSSSQKSHDGHIKPSRTTSTISTTSARSSSASSGFKFAKPNLSFKPLLYSHGNNSRNQQHMYQHHNNSNSSPSASPNGHSHHPQAPDPFANSPFPSILMSIKLPQSLLDKYVVDQESFRHGKGIWGIGQYSWTITVLSRVNGKKYVIKRVAKSLLPPSAYYHYPTTAHRLCTCPACKSSRDQLLLTGQLDQNALDNMKEVLVIDKGRKDLPQLPPSSPQQDQRQRQHPPRPQSASSIVVSSVKEPSKDTKEKRKSFNLYSCHNSSMPNQQGRFLTFSSSSSPPNTPANSRPTTPSQSPLRVLSSVTASVSSKTHNRSQSHSIVASTQKTTSSSVPHSPSLPSATPSSGPHRDAAPAVPQTSEDASSITAEQLSPRAQALRDGDSQPHADISSGTASMSFPVKPPPMSLGNSSIVKKRPALQRHASTPNLSRAVTGLDVLEDDPSRLDQLKQLAKLSKNDWYSHDDKHHLHHQKEHQSSINKEDSSRKSMDLAKKVSPFETNHGEYKQMEPESIRSTKAAAPQGFVPPPHALPMELVLLQTYNDSDHLPEHHEWTQDQDYWYYVTKAHGVRRRKLKKVSTWWLDMGSLGDALLSGSSSSSEPIATGPIYNMGRGAGTGTTTPLQSSPLSSELVLSNTAPVAASQPNGRQAPKESGLFTGSAQQEESLQASLPSIVQSKSASTIKRQSSPRNSHMGKYFYVDWDEYTSL
ncbi:hypothetical protein EDD11_007761 [Mortierella claussenii]|nr:hypothetical protein EDD11_007761 [Mortierella claussenii]